MPRQAPWKPACSNKTERALSAADVVLLMIDARIGLTPMDRYFSDWLRKAPVPIILIANKCEGKAATAGLYEAYELGFGEPVAISAEHGEGMADLHVALAPYLDAASAADELSGDIGDGADDDDTGPLQLAIVGRPNVGKSTLLNRLIGDERVITGPEPGVTRDAIAVSWDWHGQEIKLIDTAGLRRRARIQEKIEKLSAADSLRSIRFAQIVALVLDATTMAERQDLSIGDHVIREGRALVIVANKWDQVDDRKLAIENLRDRLRRSLPQVRGIPVVSLSALTGEGIDRLMPAVTKAFKTWNTRLSTGPLNRWLEDVLQRHPPAAVAGPPDSPPLRHPGKKQAADICYVFNAARRFCLNSYNKYLVNSLRETFALDGVPIRLNLRRGKNPYGPDK